ncbi:PREDICTED: 39S ribosomal protein L50, mitochondrial [Ceratosolen solmsi marchali]|uniref:Large ribosomal subunit protein mL50 n=1 Tax=Ceratosolen solmsi marchali TaxID=326594 RepID=A0AAJ6YLI1_9HYME|nr:PREDICTED: 39S ribosomal protein L50, mitochondrial [Ceratosolen solmsi marchali]
MAAFTRHACLGGVLTRWQPMLSSTTMLIIPSRGSKIKKPPQKPKKKPTIESVMASIEAKGFLRSYKPYQPNQNVSERLDRICEMENISTNDMTSIEDMDLRFKLFTKCNEEFKHCIPNSKLVEIRTIGDLRVFYQTPVITTTPYDALKNLDLPPNLHVQQDYVRFHPETDKLFNGKTAFPRSATFVTGLKYKTKYPEYIPEKPWPIHLKYDLHGNKID